MGYGLGFALTAWLTFHGPGARLDSSVLHWSISHRPRWILHCDQWIVCLGSPLLMPAALLLASLLVARRRRSWEPVRFSAISVIVLLLGVLLTKDLFARPAPSAALGSTLAPGRAAAHGLDSPWAFPSGHATTALMTWTAGARLVGEHSRAARVVPIVVGTVVGLCLVTGGFHWLTDVVAAWPLAFLLTGASAALARWHPRPGWDRLSGRYRWSGESPGRTGPPAGLDVDRVTEGSSDRVLAWGPTRRYYR